MQTQTRTQTNGRISAPELKRALDRDAQLLVLNVLPKKTFASEHIPGSLNIPVGTDNFERQVQETAVNKDQRIVVHCSDPECGASAKAVRKLGDAGYKHVEHFPGGMKAWKDQGYEVMGGAAEGATARS